MTDNKRLASSRANGRKSRGPTSLAGKLRSSKNATRHGLRVPVSAIDGLQPLVAAVALSLAGSASDGPICSLARQVAEAKVDVLRTRQAYQQAMADGGERGDSILLIERYVSRASARYRRLMRKLDAARLDRTS